MKQGPALSEIVRKRSAWGSWIGQFCSNYFLYFLLTWLPVYLVSERHFSVDGMAKVGGSTFLMAALSALLCGPLSDRWICAGTTPTRVRKTLMVVGMISNGLFLAGCAFAPDGLLVALLLLAGASFGLINSNLNAITQTLAGLRRRADGWARKTSWRTWREQLRPHLPAFWLTVPTSFTGLS
jgi:MFS family permease